MIIFGGKSTEHDISILTALQVMSAVNKEKYNLFPIYITNDGKWFFGDNLLDTKFYLNFDKKTLKEVSILPNSKYLFVKKFNKYKQFAKIDCAIISCHGKNGEDGTIQGLLELGGIPYSSSGVDGSAIGLDKSLMKQIFAYNKIPITKFIEVTKKEFETEKDIFLKILSKVDLPVVVKPNRLGSSIGISICKTQEELFEAMHLAFMFDEKVLVEKLVENLKEVNISVLGDSENAILSVTEEVQNKGFLSFDKKYLSSSPSKIKNDKKQNDIENKNLFGSKNGMQNMDRIIPANLTKTEQKQIEELSKKIFKCLNSKGVVRIDFMIDTKSRKVYANEINTIPGSFAFYLWEKSGIKFPDLIDKLVDIAEKHQKKSDSLTTTFTSSVLNQNQINFKK